MDIQQIISSHGPALLGKLQEKGFSAEQATQFLPEAGQQVMQAVSGAGIGNLLSGDAVGTIMEKIDLGGLAAKVGVDSAQAGNGLQAIIPQLLESLQGDTGGLLSKIGKKLFG